MKLLLVGDMHLRSKPPERRIEEDFKEVCLNKLRMVLEIAGQENCRAIIQAGDFFDSPNPPKDLIADVIDMLRGLGAFRDMYCIFGQHDLPYHSLAAKERSALRILEAAGAVKLLDAEGATIEEDGQQVVVRGFSFGEEVKSSDGIAEICVVHAMVGDKPLYAGQDIVQPETFMRRYFGYKLYLFGDYHYPYMVRTDKAVAVNAGALVRQNVLRDRDLKPGVVLCDTSDWSLQRIELDVRKDVFLDYEREDSSDLREKVSAFVEQLKQNRVIGVSFIQNLVRVLDEQGIDEEVRKIIWAELEKIKEMENGRE